MAVAVEARPTEKAVKTAPDIVQLRSELEMRLSELRTDRAGAEGDWLDITKFILPERGRYITQTSAKRPRASSNRILDPTASKAHQRLAAFCMAGITNPSLPWFRVGIGQDDLDDDYDVRAWLAECSRRMYRVLSSGNFYNSIHQVYEEVAGFGTGVMIMLPDFEDVIRFYSLTCGEFFLSINDRQEVDEVHREYSLTTAQLVKQFGLKNCSDTVQNAYKAKRLAGNHVVVHAIMPNRNRQPGKLGWRGRAWIGVYYERGQSGQALKIEGFDHAPFIAPRWHALAGEPYGSGPAHKALPDVKSLQAGVRQMREAAEKLLNPPLKGDARWQNSYQGQLPGDLNWIAGMDSMGTHGGLSPLFQVPPNVTVLAEEVGAYRETIKETFFNDLILAISQMEGVQPRNEMEIGERRTEKMLMLGPMLERFFGEALTPVIRLVFTRMQDVGMIPPPPKHLHNRIIEPKFISVLAQAQKAVGTTAIEQLLRLAGSMAGVWPGAAQKIDPDEVVSQYAQYLDVPSKIVVAQAIVDQRRAADAKAAQMQQAAASAQQLAQGAQTLSQTAVGGGQSALSAMLGREGGA